MARQALKISLGVHGCPRAAATEVNKEAVNAFIKKKKKNKRVTIDEIAKVLERQQSAVREMI